MDMLKYYFDANHLIFYSISELNPDVKVEKKQLSLLLLLKLDVLTKRQHKGNYTWPVGGCYCVLCSAHLIPGSAEICHTAGRAECDAVVDIGQVLSFDWLVTFSVIQCPCLGVCISAWMTTWIKRLSQAPACAAVTHSSCRGSEITNKSSRRLQFKAGESHYCQEEFQREREKWLDGEWMVAHSSELSFIHLFGFH